ncbi:MAG: hypothetical protein ACXAC2_01880 [Candidatus Kariarchaeaceae archaeon]|jgi:hypothetical protein
MPKNPQEPPFKSSLAKENTRERYRATVPLPVGREKGKWIIEIKDDNTIVWNRPEE